MSRVVRFLAIFGIFIVTALAWTILGGVMIHRSESQTSALRGRVVDLWGQPQSQAGPSLSFERPVERVRTRTEKVGGVERQIEEKGTEINKKPVSFASTQVNVDLHLDQRRKGLAFYSLYDVRFQGAWTYEHTANESGTLNIEFRFPDTAGVYDGFKFVLDGKPLELRPQGGTVETTIPVVPGQKVTLAIAYKSRGLDMWRYVPSPGVAALRNFDLVLTTDFNDIDFPASTLSPSTKEVTATGMKLRWAFEHVVTGQAIGMRMPEVVQPGQLAASLSFSAPISLLFFFLILLVLSQLRGLDIHPINFLFLGAAFFAFHLLFAYTVDHLPVTTAFAIASGVSVFLVVTYLRLVVSPRFALLEAGISQLVYLIGFSLAHFWEGFTGLTVTVLSIVTLFVLMQLTGRIKWSSEGERKPAVVPR